MELKDLHTPKDLKKCSLAQLQSLAEELRREIIQVMAQNEGHLGANLGVIELSLALHFCFNTPEDLLVWDVGHQAYAHKILTGRRKAFQKIRQWEQLSGFPKREESPYDAFGTGHAGTSISAVLGMALANQLQQRERWHIAVIGDASIASGMALEALNHLGTTQARVLIVLNDNTMGIDPSVGALKTFFESLPQPNNTQTNPFETAFNIPYHGPIDGHNLAELQAAFHTLKQKSGPKLLHIRTTKGKGLEAAEIDQTRFHAPGKFDPLTGKIQKKEHVSLPKYKEIFGRCVLSLAELDSRLVAITPAMPTGSGLIPMFEKYPDRSFDVGIAEQHAVTLAAGMATQGLLPICCIYSTFLQRAYDQLIHDVALQNLPIIFAVDRAGLVGHDGPTHHGVFDLAYLRCIPQMTVVAPADAAELCKVLYSATQQIQGPIAIRYPRGLSDLSLKHLPLESIEWGQGRCIKEGDTIAVISIGHMAIPVAKAIAETSQPERYAHYDLRFIKPIDTHLLDTIFLKFSRILHVEDGCISGGAGSAVLEYAYASGAKVQIELAGISDQFVPHGSVDQLLENQGLSVSMLRKRLEAME
ncbi:MAG: 1-deoxy-D-xylulose-5-phosphate synthase [Flavobacteriaceae bacterium]